MSYHVFFTTIYTDACLQNCRFGATSANSLAQVKRGDIAFLFDGLRWKIYGPLQITSSTQYRDETPIYGTNMRGAVNYPNRVSFASQSIREILLNKLFGLETDPTKKTYLLNRTLLSVIIANKQVHSTPLIEKEGEYVYQMIIEFGEPCKIKSKDFDEGVSVVDYVMSSRKPKSEAIFEMLLLESRCALVIPELAESKYMYNQFVLGIQRQVDILSISENAIVIVELKKKENKSNPYEQLEEYRDYALSDYRLEEFKGRDVKLIALLEEGNTYLDKSISASYSDISVFQFSMTKNYEFVITNMNTIG